jgi:hypothetical protein
VCVAPCSWFTKKELTGKNYSADEPLLGGVRPFAGELPAPLAVPRIPLRGSRLASLESPDTRTGQEGDPAATGQGKAADWQAILPEDDPARAAYRR